MNSKKENSKVIKFNGKTPFKMLLLFLLVIVAYIVAYVFNYFNKEDISYFEVTRGSNDDEVSQVFQGIAIRDELTVKTKQGGYIDYFVNENSRVSKNTILYSVDSTGKLKRKLDKLNANAASLTDENLATISENIYEFSNNYNDMKFSEVYNFKTSIKGKVVDLVNRNSLNKISKKNKNYSINKADVTGIVLYRTDGFEKLKPSKLKVEYFNNKEYKLNKITSGDKVNKGDVVYKTINDEEWSVAIPLSDKDAKKYKKTEAVNITFLSDNLETKANFKIIKGADYKNYGIITLSKYVIRYSTERLFNIKIVGESLNGLKIPKSAMVHQRIYKIPKKFGIRGGNSTSKVGFRVRNDKNIKADIEPKYIDINGTDDKYYYISSSNINAGDILDGINSNDMYIVSEYENAKGVFDISNGYARFVKVNEIYKTDEYYLVKRDQFGLHEYDRIALDGSTLKDRQIISR